MALCQYLERRGDDALILKYHDKGGVAEQSETWRCAATILEAYGLQPDDFFGVDDEGNIVVTTSKSDEPVTETPAASFGDGNTTAMMARLRQLAGEAGSHDDHGGGD